LTSQQHGEQHPVSAVQPRLEVSTTHQGSRTAKALPAAQLNSGFVSSGRRRGSSAEPVASNKVAAAASSRGGSTSIARRPRSGCMPQQELQALFATLGAYFALLFRTLARFVGEPGAVESEGEFELLALAAQRIERAEAEANYPLGWTVEE